MLEEWQERAKNPGKRYMEMMVQYYDTMATVWRKTNEHRKKKNSDSGVKDN